VFRHPRLLLPWRSWRPWRPWREALLIGRMPDTSRCPPAPIHSALRPPPRRRGRLPMLTAEQVIPFLQDDDAEVRQHAVLYLAGAHDPAPATAEDFWQAIDKVGQSEAFPFVDR